MSKPVERVEPCIMITAEESESPKNQMKTEIGTRTQNRNPNESKRQTRV